VQLGPSNFSRHFNSPYIVISHSETFHHALIHFDELMRQHPLYFTTLYHAVAIQNNSRLCAWGLLYCELCYCYKICQNYSLPLTILLHAFKSNPPAHPTYKKFTLRLITSHSASRTDLPTLHCKPDYLTTDHTATQQDCSLSVRSILNYRTQSN